MGLEGIRSFVSGGGGGSGQLPKYPDVASLPASAADGDLAIVLDTNTIYMYEDPPGNWVAVSAPGAPISVSDTDSIDLTLLLNDISADLVLSTDGPDANNQAVALNIQTAPNDPGLRAQIPNASIRGLFSATAPITYNSTTGVIEIPVADAVTDGYLSAVDWNTFNNKLDAIAVTDTNSIDLTLTGGDDISAALRITSDGPDANNQAVALNVQGGGSPGLRAQIPNSSIRTLLSASTPISYDNTTGAFSVSDNDITLAKIQQIATASFLGRDTAGAGNVEVLSVAEAQALLGTSGTNTGDVTLAAVGSAPNANAATLTGQVLNLQPADVTNPGVVTGTTQIFGGDKIFDDSIQTNASFLFRDSTTNLIGIAAPSSVTSYNLTLPNAQGATFTYLQNDGTGVLSWATAASANLNVTTQSSADYTALTTDGFIRMSTGDTNRTLTLFTAVGNTGFVLRVSKVDSGLGYVIIDGNSTETINGAASVVLTDYNETTTLVANGTNWDVLT